MLKEFAQYLQSLKDNKIYTINGETYSDHDLVRIKPHVDHPGCLRVTGLDSIVKLIRNELEMLEALPVYIRVDGAKEVSVRPWRIPRASMVETAVLYQSSARTSAKLFSPVR